MTPMMVQELVRVALLTALTLAAPLLGVALTTGITVSVLQTATGVQEQTLSFVPKAIAIGLTFFLLLPWFIDVATGFSVHLFTQSALLAK